MHLVARQIRPDDIETVLRICCPGSDTDLEMAQRVRDEWNALWSNGVNLGVAVEDLEARQQPHVVGLLWAIFIEDDFLKEALTNKDPFIVSRVASLCRQGRSPLLEEEDLAIRNAGSGLNMLICNLGWEGEDHKVYPAANIRSFVVNAFVERHGGYRLQHLIGELGGIELLELATKSGCTVLNEYRDWTLENNMVDHPRRPFLVGASRPQALQSENYWMVRMFTYFPPRFFFTISQRAILLFARDGYTDTEIADELGTTSDAVKKRWAGIYERVAAVLPGLLPESPTGGRGAEKRRALLAHLRDRPEELRPFERRPSHLHEEAVALRR